MTINCVRERLLVIHKLWNREHNAKVCNILLQQLKSDIIFFCGEKTPDDLENEIKDLQEEICEYDHNK